MRVALVTAAAARGLDDDIGPLAAALEAIGAQAVVADWHDPGVDWASFDAAILRSPWDYIGRREEFLAWAERTAAATMLCNPAQVLRWNTDKRYLAELAAGGAATVPTEFFAPGSAVLLPERGEYVVKPSVSAGALDTLRFTTAQRQAALAHARAIHASGRTVMVQPYVSAVDTAGETALLFIADAYSHSIRKGPLLEVGKPTPDGLFAPEQITPREPSAEQRAAAERVLDLVPGGRDRLLYARVDLVPGPDATPLLLELELTEPSLFLTKDPPAARRFAEAIAARLGVDAR